MKTSELIFLFALSLLSFSLFAQAEQCFTEHNPYIEVTGTAEMKIIPDEITINFSMSEKFAGRKKITIEEQESNLKERLIAIDVDTEQLFLSHVNADYVKVRWSGKQVRAKSQYTIMVVDAITVGKVFQIFEEMEISNAHIAKVSHSKIYSLKREVKILAIKAAKNKADYLLNAIGENTGKPLIINEVGPITSFSNVTNSRIRGARSEETPYFIDGMRVNDFQNKTDMKINEIQFKKIKLISSVYAKFLIQ
jgi:uncharacterized protein